MRRFPAFVLPALVLAFGACSHVGRGAGEPCARDDAGCDVQEEDAAVQVVEADASADIDALDASQDSTDFDASDVGAASSSDAAGTVADEAGAAGPFDAGSGAVDASVSPGEETCLNGRWCWWLPRTPGDDYTSVWGTGP